MIGLGLDLNLPTFARLQVHLYKDCRTVARPKCALVNLENSWKARNVKKLRVNTLLPRVYGQFLCSSVRFVAIRLKDLDAHEILIWVIYLHHCSQ